MYKQAQMPMEINIKNPKNPNTTHSLFAIICRSDTNKRTFATYGHYYTYVRIKDKWYYFNDLETNPTMYGQEHMINEEMKNIVEKAHSCIYVEK